MSSPTRPGPLLAVLVAAPFLASADVTIVNVATPAIRSGLDASVSDLQFVVGGYIVAYAVLLITGARLGQSHGYKRLLLGGIAGFGACSLGGGLAPDIAVLICCRVLQGVTAALMLPQALTGIQLHFHGERRTHAVGMLAVAMTTGAVVGQVLGGALVWADLAGSGWRPILLVNVPVCLATIVVGAKVLPADDRRHRRRLDLRGVAALSLSVLLVVVPLTFGPDLGWATWTWAALAASPVVFGLFLRVERHALSADRVPLLDTATIARPAIRWALVAILAGYGTYFALLFTLAQYLQTGLGHSALFSGLIFLPWVVAFAIPGQARRYLPPNIIATLPIAGFLLLAVAYLILGATAMTGHLSVTMLVVLFIPGGVGLGTVFTTMLNHVTNSVATEHAPDISGVFTTATQLSASIAIAGYGTLYQTLAGDHSPGFSFGVTALAFGTASLAASVPAHIATRQQPTPTRPTAGTAPTTPAPTATRRASGLRKHEECSERYRILASPSIQGSGGADGSTGVAP